MTETPAPVVAAVDHRGWSSVVAEASTEALRRGAALHLVHADPADPAATGAAPAAADLLALAAHDAAQRLGAGVEVTTTLAESAPVSAVVAVAEGAALVVVGRSSRCGHAYPYARSVTGGVGARTSAPVLSVPDDWAGTPADPRVVVGIDDPDRASDVLAAGVEAARSRAARLVVLSAWWRPLGAGSSPLTHVTDAGQAEALEAVLDRVVGRVTDVPVEVVVRRARPGEALLDAARGAALVVLGRHDTLVPSGSHLGPVARAVLREAECPVLLATPRRHHWVEPTVAHGHLPVAAR